MCCCSCCSLLSRLYESIKGDQTPRPIFTGLKTTGQLHVQWEMQTVRQCGGRPIAGLRTGIPVRYGDWCTCESEAVHARMQCNFISLHCLCRAPVCWPANPVARHSLKRIKHAFPTNIYMIYIITTPSKTSQEQRSWSQRLRGSWPKRQAGSPAVNPYRGNSLVINQQPPATSSSYPCTCHTRYNN